MKLLFLAHRIPYPPNKGDKIRSHHELRALVERGHEVHLLAFADDSHDLHYQIDLGRLCASVRIIRLRKVWAKLRALFTLLSSRPLSLGYFDSWKMRRLVKRALKQQCFDAVFVFSSSMAQYIPPEWRSRTVVDLVDVDSEKWREYAARTSPPQSWIYSLEARRLRAFEYEIVAGFANSILTTSREADLLTELDEFTRRARLRILTMGVDANYYQPVRSGKPGSVIALRPVNDGAKFAEPIHRRGAKNAEEAQSERQNLCAPSAELRASAVKKSHDSVFSSSALGSTRLVFVGAMDYFANVEAVQWFVAEVFPLIRHQEPLTEFVIVGSNPTAAVKKLAEQPGVKVTGTVADVRPYLREATLCVIPLRIARGVQTKMLEAMACGKAIVATSDAAAGLRLAHDDQALLADSSSEFASTVIELIRNQELRERLGEQARRFVEMEHDWKPLLQKLTDLLEAVGQRRAPTKTKNIRAIARK
ncbi:MAG: glycosyltransferase [Blastocatellia bacterium]